MQLTLQAIPKSIRSPYTTRHSNAKSELTRCKNRSRELHAAVSRSEVLGFGSSRGASSDSPYGNEMQRLLAGTETLDDGSRRLMDSQRIALETEEQGADILRNLRVQREQIENSRNMVRLRVVSPACRVLTSLHSSTRRTCLLAERRER